MYTEQEVIRLLKHDLGRYFSGDITIECENIVTINLFWQQCENYHQLAVPCSVDIFKEGYSLFIIPYIIQTLTQEQNKIFDEVVPLDINKYKALISDFLYDEIEEKVIDIKRFQSNGGIRFTCHIQLLYNSQWLEFHIDKQYDEHYSDHIPDFIEENILSHLVSLANMHNIPHKANEYAAHNPSFLFLRDHSYQRPAIRPTINFNRNRYENYLNGSWSTANKQSNQKAEKLLLECLTNEQKTQYEVDKTFIVIGNITGAEYRIMPSKQMNIKVLTGKWQGATGCVVSKTSVPLGDHQLAQKLLIECNEGLFLEKVIYH